MVRFTGLACKLLSVEHSNEFGLFGCIEYEPHSMCLTLYAIKLDQLCKKNTFFQNVIIQ